MYKKIQQSHFEIIRLQGWREIYIYQITQAFFFRNRKTIFLLYFKL